jgi:hypothetical protein
MVWNSFEGQLRGLREKKRKMIEAPLAEDYLSGMTYEQLREKYSVSNDTIKLCLCSQGYPDKLTKAGQESDQQREDALELFLSGMDRKRISRETGVTRKRIDYFYKQYTRKYVNQLNQERDLRLKREFLGLK